MNDNMKDLENTSLTDEHLDQVSGGNVLVIPTIPSSGHKRTSARRKGLFEEDPDQEPMEAMHSMR